MIAFSIVVPIKNEAPNLEPLLGEIWQSMEKLGQPWELIVVDDGSTDASLSLLHSLKDIYPMLRLIAFDRNYGQTSAFDAGFQSAKGQFIITLDGDGQNDPADILRMYRLIDECDLVCGLRKKRADNWIKQRISAIANRFRSSWLRDEVSDTGCSLKIFRKAALEKITLYHGLHRFFPALFQIHGFKVSTLPVNHRPRFKGKSHYRLTNRFLSPIVDLLAVKWMQKRALRYRIKESDR